LDSTIKKCLLVDDDQDDREIFQLAISEIGINIDCFFYYNAIDALNGLKSGGPKPDIIFLDLNMPLMTGIQCLIELKKIDSIEKTPIIIYSTSSDPSFKSEAIKNGAHAYIIKPNRLSDLVTVLKATIYNE
jgi:CheY-like chemotaxis protein